MNLVDVERLREIAEVEFDDIVEEAYTNAPHRRWQPVVTFPHHFHDGGETNVIESHIGTDPEMALRQFLAFVRANMRFSSITPQ